jgi:hypothetical protein
VDCIVFVAMLSEVFQRIGLDEAVRVSWLWRDVHPGYIESSASVSFPGATSAAEQVQQRK